MASKYQKGEPVRDPVEAVRLILAGQPLYERHKVQTQGWMMSWPLHEIARKSRFGDLAIAVATPTEDTQK
jgi:hypothetical protein